MGKTYASVDQGLLFDAVSTWESPTELPDLSNETEVAIDTETKDPGLANDMGPGFHKYKRNDSNTGYICGISAAWRDQKIYIPLNHRETKCFDHETVGRWLKNLISQKRTRFVFHSFQYDWGWIQTMYGILPPELIDDVAAMAAMINENLNSYSLDELCKWQGLPGKDESILNEAARLRKIKGGDVKKFLYLLPGRHVGPYAEADAEQTLQLAGKLRPQLTDENLDVAYQVECDLMPITLKMKLQGIRVDANRAEQLAEQITQRCDDELFDFGKRIGERVTIKEIRSNRWLRRQFEDHGIEYPRTLPTEQYAEGQASFEKNFMSNHQHWLPRTVYHIKHQHDIASKFFKKFICSYAHNDRVYPTINQFRSEQGGTRSHRFSYSDPPLQQTPSRDDELAPLVRSCFLPEDGEEWCSIDWQQQEYRLIVFVAELCRCRGATQAADMYRNDPTTDFHNYVAEITKLHRRRAKDVNFATSYGAGTKKFALMTGMDYEEAEATLKQYNERLPFVKEVSSRYARYAAEHGHIRLIDGSRSHFNLWEPVYRDFAKEYKAKEANSEIETTPCFEDEYNRRKEDKNHPWYGERQKRAFTHKAFNRMIQGSAARQMKKAMILCYQSGNLPLLQLHDELGFSIKDRAQAKVCAEIMETAMPVITIPMLTDVKIGPSWGELKK